MDLTKFENYLNKHDEKDWEKVLETLLSAIHEVDRNAVKIWFRFYPLALHRFLENAEDKEKVVQQFVIKGDFELKDQIDSSHEFLYGHRFWKQVKAEIETQAKQFDSDNADLANVIKKIAATVAGEVKRDESLLVGIAAVGLMTLAQVGLEAFKNASGETAKPKGRLAKSPEKILAERNKEDKGGFFAFLKTVDKEFSVTYDETKRKSKFDIIFDEEIASASARHQTEDWRAADERCWEGVVPVECRSAACGTCWVGIIAGAEKLSDVQRLERKQMKVFGYKQADEAKPLMRLACQAQAQGSVTIVIPTWNGVFGKKIYGLEEIELKPATTSAVKLRESIKEVLSQE